MTSAETHPRQRPARRSGRSSGRRFGALWWRDTIDEAARSSPARLALTVFVFVITFFTALLSLPFATESGQPAPLADALFVATSAVCVTGLTTVNIPEYFSPFGEGVLLVAMQVGGIGVLTLASILGVAVSRRLGLRTRLIAASETKALRLGEVGSLLRTILIVSLSIEAVLFVVLTSRFLALGEPLAQASWHGVFYAVSSFNNVGFIAHPEGLQEFVGDPWFVLPMAAGVFVGSLGFPVLLVVLRSWRPREWDLHTKITLTATTVLLVLAFVVLGTMEWRNTATLARLDVGERLLATLFLAVMPRSGGFSTVETGAMNPESWLVTDALMFIGGGSASTAGGIRVTTLAVLVLAVVAEARGDVDVEGFRRRVPAGSIRIAVTVLLVGATVVLLSTIGLMAMTNHTLDRALFETISAFATCGLSTGITGDLPDGAKYLLTATMFIGRTGTMTLAAALALRERRRMFRLPEERPIIG